MEALLKELSIISNKQKEIVSNIIKLSKLDLDIDLIREIHSKTLQYMELDIEKSCYFKLIYKQQIE